jgi:hypothetical protein
MKIREKLAFFSPLDENGVKALSPLYIIRPAAA